MIRKITSLFLAGTLLLMSSCASIVSKSNYPLSINSYPSEAKISIADKKGKVVYTGQTPAQVQLKAGAGFFSKAGYTVTFEKDGFEASTVPVEFKLDGWYFGNILFGGLIGLLIVDPATGAMYKLDTSLIEHNLPQLQAQPASADAGVSVYSINDIPENWVPLLEAIQTN